MKHSRGNTRTGLSGCLGIALIALMLTGANGTGHAAGTKPLATRNSLQWGLGLGYGYSFESNRDVRFLNVYPWVGRVLSDPVGSGWYRGTLEGIFEGAFSFVVKNQNKYAAGANLLLRYNFLAPRQHLRPYAQLGFGATLTNLDMEDFDSGLNFASTAACGLQYFFSRTRALTLEWRFFHLSNAGLSDDNSGLNMNNVFIGYSHLL